MINNDAACMLVRFESIFSFGCKSQLFILLWGLNISKGDNIGFNVFRINLKFRNEFIVYIIKKLSDGLLNDLKENGYL